MLTELKSDLRKCSNSQKAIILQRFFKTGKGEYGEGDVFLGVIVPDIRKVAIKHKNLPLENIEILLKSKIHEERLCALFILVHIFDKSITDRKKIFDFYLKNIKSINNWDLVDLSAPRIVGYFLYLYGKEYPQYKNLLVNLAKSSNIWERRISIISTIYFITKGNQFEETLKLSEMLINDKQDLIHKAVGWMLREIGKKDVSVLESFLKENYKIMPRTMLRYAIERFPESKRKAYLIGKV